MKYFGSAFYMLLIVCTFSFGQREGDLDRCTRPGGECIYNEELDPFSTIIPLPKLGQPVIKNYQETGRVEPDGTFTIVTANELYHYTHDGVLINRIGNDGPKVDIMGCHFISNSHYWVVDYGDLSSLIYSKTGEFMQKLPGHYVANIQAVSKSEAIITPGMVYRSHIDYYEKKTGLFASDLNPPFMVEKTNHSPDFVPQLHRFDVQLSDTNIFLEEQGKPFFLMTEPQIEHGYRFKLTWVVPHGSRQYIVNQIDPFIFPYRQIDFEHEAKAEYDTPNAGPKIAFHIDDFKVIPGRAQHDPKGYKHHKDLHKAVMKWKNSFSRTTYFGAYKNGFVLSYLLPKCEHCGEISLGVQRFTRGGKAIGKPVYLEGMMLGSYKDKVYALKARDEKDLSKVDIVVLKFP